MCRSDPAQDQDTNSVNRGITEITNNRTTVDLHPPTIAIIFGLFFALMISFAGLRICIRKEICRKRRNRSNLGQIGQTGIGMPNVMVPNFQPFNQNQMYPEGDGFQDQLYPPRVIYLRNLDQQQQKMSRRFTEIVPSTGVPMTQHPPLQQQMAPPLEEMMALNPPSRELRTVNSTACYPALVQTANDSMEDQIQRLNQHQQE